MKKICYMCQREFQTKDRVRVRNRRGRSLRAFNAKTCSKICARAYQNSFTSKDRHAIKLLMGIKVRGNQK